MTTTQTEKTQLPRQPDRHGNVLAMEGCDRCPCGCKYWEHDRCIDCGAGWVATDHLAAVQEITPCAKHWVGDIPERCPDCRYGVPMMVRPS